MQHGLQTENCLSLIKLYAEGLLKNVRTRHPTSQSIAADPERPFPIDDEDYQVAVPEIDLQLTYLHNASHPLEDDSNSSKNMYIQCKHILLDVFQI